MKQRVNKVSAMMLGASNLGALSLIFLFKGDDDGAGLCACGGGALFFLLYLAVIVIILMGYWKMFVKAGKPGWAAIIPIYNIITLCEIVGRPTWWVILFFIPLANIYALIMISLDLAKSYGKDTGYAIGLILLPVIFIPMLGFGSAEYKGPSVPPGQTGF